MSTAEWVALAVAAVALVAVLAVLVGLRGLRRSVANVQASVDALADGAATVEDLRAALRAALAGEPDPQVEPVAPVVSRVPPVLRTRSVVKAMALGTGTAHAARRLRNGRS